MALESVYGPYTLMDIRLDVVHGPKLVISWGPEGIRPEAVGTALEQQRKLPLRT